MRLRLLSPLGFYPAGDVETRFGRFVIENDVAFIVTRVGPIQHNSESEIYSAIEFLTLEEARFLGCLTISWPVDEGMISFYPFPHHLDVSPALTARDELLAVARTHALGELRESRGLVLPPSAGGPAYRRQERGVDESFVDGLCELVEWDVELRGLGALVRADMLWARREFAEPAIAYLHVMMEASKELMFDILRDEGNPKPTSKDASARLAAAFREQPLSGYYFEDYYKDRVMIVHPSSKYGTFISPPLQEDDYYDLRHHLVRVFLWLITGDVPETNFLPDDS